MFYLLCTEVQTWKLTLSTPSGCSSSCSACSMPLSTLFSSPLFTSASPMSNVWCLKCLMSFLFLKDSASFKLSLSHWMAVEQRMQSILNGVQEDILEHAGVMVYVDVYPSSCLSNTYRQDLLHVFLICLVEAVYHHGHWSQRQNIPFKPL